MMGSCGCSVMGHMTLPALSEYMVVLVVASVWGGCIFGMVVIDEPVSEVSVLRWIVTS